MAQVLLEYGAKVGDKELREALLNDFEDMLHLLLEWTRGLSPNYLFFNLVCEKGRMDLLEFLIEGGLNPNQNNGVALVVSSAAGHIQVVQLLLDWGA